MRQITGADAVTRMGRDKQPPREARQIGHYKDRFALLNDVTDKFIDARLDEPLDLGDRSPRFILLAFFIGCGTNTDGNFIARQYLEHFVGWDEHFASVRRYGEPVAVLRSLDGGVDALILSFEFITKPLELRHRIAIEHGRCRLLRFSA